MATNFKRWVENPSSAQDGNVLPETGETSFANNTQRQNGYAAGQTISAKLLNTILHQLSICQVALFDQVCPDADINYMSTLDQIKTALSRILVKQRYLHTIKISFRDEAEGGLTYELTCTIESSDATPITSMRDLFGALPMAISGKLYGVMQEYVCDVIAFPCKDHSGSEASGQGFVIQYQKQANSSTVSSYYAQWSDVYSTSITDTVTSRW